MKNFQNFGVAVVGVDAMSWPLRVAGPAAAAAHPAAATHVAIPAIKRPAAATVASVYRGPT
jgi:hypothetical protein